MVVMIIIIGYSGDDGCYADDGDDDVGDDDGNDGDDNYEYDECVNDDCNACGVGCEYTNVFVPMFLVVMVRLMANDDSVPVYDNGTGVDGGDDVDGEDGGDDVDVDDEYAY